MAKSNYSALQHQESTLHERGEKGIGGESEFVSEKRFGRVSQIRPL